jgi:hypothetical protein
MSASEIMEQINHLPMEDQKAIFVFLTKKVIGGENGSKQWLRKNLSFEEACDVVFRENRELLSALAK